MSLNNRGPDLLNPQTFLFMAFLNDDIHRAYNLTTFKPFVASTNLQPSRGAGNKSDQPLL